MFDKLKQLKQIKELQDSLAKEKEEGEKNGIKVIINGKMEIEEISIPNNESLGKDVKDCLNETMHKVQMKAAQKMSQMTGFGL